MDLRSLTTDDAADVARLWHAGALESGASHPLFEPRMTAERYAATIVAELDGGDVFGWGVFEERALLGYLTAKLVGASETWVQEAHIYILDVDVERSSRRKGYARALVGAAVEHARVSRVPRIELGWLSDDPRSSAVWKSLGFRSYLVRGFIDVDAS